jgi:protein gp37
MGVSVENSRVFDRVNDLRDVPAAVRFLSCDRFDRIIAWN